MGWSVCQWYQMVTDYRRWRSNQWSYTCQQNTAEDTTVFWHKLAPQLITSTTQHTFSDWICSSKEVINMSAKRPSQSTTASDVNYCPEKHTDLHMPDAVDPPPKYEDVNMGQMTSEFLSNATAHGLGKIATSKTTARRVRQSFTNPANTPRTH